MLKLDFKRKKTKGGKLKDRFVGPYKILSCLPHRVYQYQLGSDDCGLFAIANACEICFGRDPSIVKYTQKDMRKHLVTAFDTLKLMSSMQRMVPCTVK